MVTRYKTFSSESPMAASISELQPTETAGPDLNPWRLKYFWLYSFHASSLWWERTFDFAGVLFLSKLFPGTLIMTSIYGLVSSIAPMLLSFIVGRTIDESKKLTAVRITLFFQKLGIIIVYGCLVYLAIRSTSGLDETHYSSQIAFSVLLLGGAMMKLSTHWLVVLTQKDSSLLSELNAILRRIELCCGALAPLFISLLTNKFSTLTVAISLACLTAASMALELFVVLRMYGRFPILAATEILVEQARAQNTNPTDLLKQMVVFLRHPLFPTALSLAMLYGNVLSFGGSMIAYTKNIGFSDLAVSLVTGACTLTGVVGTFLAPRLVARAELKKAGVYFIFQEVFYLALVVVAIYLLPSDSLAFRVLLIAGVVMARIGLCGFDLVQLQLIQEGVALNQLGVFVGFQFGLQNSFDLFQFLLTIIWPRPEQFLYPGLVSWLVVGLSFVNFLTFVIRTPSPAR